MASKVLKEILNVSSEELNTCDNSLEILATKSTAAKPNNMRIKVRTKYTGLILQIYVFKWIPLIIKFHTVSDRKKNKILYCC